MRYGMNHRLPSRCCGRQGMGHANDYASRRSGPFNQRPQYSRNFMQRMPQRQSPYGQSAGFMQRQMLGLMTNMLNTMSQMVNMMSQLIPQNMNPFAGPQLGMQPGMQLGNNSLGNSQQTKNLEAKTNKKGNVEIVTKDGYKIATEGKSQAWTITSPDGKKTRIWG